MKIQIKRMVFLLALGLTLLLSETKTTYAAAFSSGKDGTYTLNGSLSCYVPAMGGVEFGAPLVKGIKVTISGGDATMTVSFRKSQVTIYSVTCDTFLSATEGKTGYYDKNGSFHTAQTSLSSDTAKNPANEDVKYIASMTFPLDQKTNTYKLGVYVDSNVMGTQFGADGNYEAVLTVDWSSVPEKEAQTSATAKKEETTASTKTEKNTTVPSNGTMATKENTKKEEKSESVSSQTSTQEEQTSQETALPDQSSTASEEVVEKDGLNIHYAEQEQEKETEKTKDQKGILVGTVVILIMGAGVGLVFWIRRKR